MNKLPVDKIILLSLLVSSCATTRIPDPGIRCPQPPAELLQPPEPLKPLPKE